MSLSTRLDPLHPSRIFSASANVQHCTRQSTDMLHRPTQQTQTPNLKEQIRAQFERVLRGMDRTHLISYNDVSDSLFAGQILNTPVLFLLNPPQSPCTMEESNPRQIYAYLLTRWLPGHRRGTYVSAFPSHLKSNCLLMIPFSATSIHKWFSHTPTSIFYPILNGV